MLLIGGKMNWSIHDYETKIKELIQKFESKEEYIFYTSGTTGEPKKIIHNYEVIKQVAEEQVFKQNLTKDSIIFSIIPPTTIALSCLSVLPAFISKCTYIQKKFNPHTYWNDILTYKPTHHIFLPEIFSTLSPNKMYKDIDLSFMECAITGSNKPPKGIKQSLLNKGVKKFIHMYGSTEVPPSVAFGENEEYLNNFSDKFEHKIIDGEWVIKWNAQKDWWYSGDMVEHWNDGIKILNRKKPFRKQKRIIK